MAFPRQIVAGRYWLLTRRCTQGLSLLKPDAEVNGVFDYNLADAALRCHVDVVGYQVMSNHYHAVVRDNDGRLPAFMEHLNKMTARALNVKWNRKENFWAAKRASAVHLVKSDDVLRKLLYTLMNPVRANLVEHVRDWPGANSYEITISGKPIVVERPTLFYQKKGKKQKELTLALCRPPGFEDYSQDEWAHFIQAQIRGLEEQHRAERVNHGLPILGRRRALHRSPFTVPKMPLPSGRVCPEVACSDRVALRRTLRELREFRRAHEAARIALKAHNTNVVFPYGTYRMRLMGLQCAGPP